MFDTTVSRTLNGIFAQVIPTSKFKTTTLSLYFEQPLTREFAALNALTLRLLVKATKVKNPMQLNQKLQDLYGAYLQADAYKYGDLQSLQLKLTCVCDRHLSQPILESALALLYELVYEPVSGFSGFEQLVILEKKSLLTALAARKQDKTAYAYDRMIEGYFSDEAFSLSAYGDEASIEAVSPEQVKAQIEKVFQKAHHHLIAMGHLEPEAFFYSVEKLGVTVAAPMSYPINPWKAKSLFRRWEEEDVVSQTKLNLVYGLDVGDTAKEYYVAMLFSHILGGGASSRLFEDLREKQSLCYYIHARVDKFKRLMSVMSGVRYEVYDRVIREVNEHIERLLQEAVDDQTLERSKKMLMGSYKALTDSPISYMNFVHSQRLVGLPEDLASVDALLGSVTVDDLVKMNQAIVPLAAFALIPEKRGEFND